MQYKIVRTQNAGVFFAHIIERRGTEADLADSRRLWYWEGAASLSELALRGTSEPDDCKFSVPVNETVLGVIEILDVTPIAQKSIESVPEWSAHD